MKYLLERFGWQERQKSTSIDSLEDLAGLLQNMGCKHIEEVINETKTIGVRWTIDKQRNFFNSSEERPIVPRTIVFTTDEKGKTIYFLEVGGEAVTTESDNLISNSFEWSDNPNERFNPVHATYYFLFDFAEEPHASFHEGQIFGFQFYTGTQKSEKDVRVKMGSTMFTFKPTNGANSPIGGRVRIETR